MDHIWWAPQMHKKLSGPKMESQLRNTFGQSLIATLYSKNTPILRLPWDYSHSEITQRNFIYHQMPIYYHMHHTHPSSHWQTNLIPLLLFSDSVQTIPKWPPEYSSCNKILLLNKCTQTPCRLWQVGQYLHSNDGNEPGQPPTWCSWWWTQKLL